MTEFNTIADLYLQVGILGLCAILMVYQVWHNYKSNKKKDEQTHSANQENIQSMINLLKEQNWEYQKQYQDLLDKILTSVNKPHVLTKEESEKVSKVSNKINQILKEILNNTSADRVVLLQYHNGGRGMNGQSFLKMSITNEQIKIGTKPIINIIKDQFRSSFSHLVETLDKSTGIQSLPSIKKLLNIDVHSYEFLNSLGVSSIYGVSIKNESLTPIGILLLTYSEENISNTEIITKNLEDSGKTIEVLLNL